MFGGGSLRLVACLCLFFLVSISPRGVAEAKPDCPKDNAAEFEAFKKQLPPCSTVAACQAAVKDKDKSAAHRNTAMEACVALWSPCILTQNPHAPSAVGACGKTIKSRETVAALTGTNKESNQALFDAYNNACQAMGAQAANAVIPDSKDDKLFVHMFYSTHTSGKCSCRKNTGLVDSTLATYAQDGHFVVCNAALTPDRNGVWNAWAVGKLREQFTPCEGGGTACLKSGTKGRVAAATAVCCGPGTKACKDKSGEEPWVWPPQLVFDKCCQSEETNRQNLFPLVSNVDYDKGVPTAIQYVCACGPTKAAPAHAQPQRNWLWDGDGDAAPERVERIETMGQELANAGFERGWEAGLKLNRMENNHAQNRRRRNRGGRGGRS